MGKPQPAAKSMKYERTQFDKNGLHEKLNSRIRQALEERPRAEDVDDDMDWRSKTGEYPIIDLLRVKSR